jgi:heme-degrading monooxygenase HmoA
VVDGKLRAGNYVISATYLQLRQEPMAQQRFGELMGPILAELQTRPGLLAISLGTSSRCGVARTLSVWQEDIAMFGFVASPAHTAAVRAVKEVSRGGSLVTHWTGDAAQATWSAAAEHAAQDDGPLY